MRAVGEHPVAADTVGIRVLWTRYRNVILGGLVAGIGGAYLTVGSVRNFAFFLGLSTLCDLAVAYFFTRPSVLLLSRTHWMARRKVMGIEASVGAGR